MTALKDYGSSGDFKIYNGDGSEPICTFAPGVIIRIVPSSNWWPEVNGYIKFWTQNGTLYREIGQYYQNGSWTNGATSVDIYAISFRKYWAGTCEGDFELYIDNERII